MPLELPGPEPSCLVAPRRGLCSLAAGPPSARELDDSHGDDTAAAGSFQEEEDGLDIHDRNPGPRLDRGACILRGDSPIAPACERDLGQRRAPPSASR